MAGFSGPRIMRNGGGGSFRGGFIGPRRVVVPIRPPVITVQPIRETVIPYYDPSRIIKDIKVVTDLRQSGTERGETQTATGGFLGPGSGDVAPTTGAPEAPGQNPLVPIALAVAAFILFGG